MIFSSFPFLRFLIFYICGVLCYRFNLIALPAQIFYLLIALFFILSFFKRVSKIYEIGYFTGISFLLLILTFGYFRASLYDESNAHNHIINYPKTTVYEATIIQPPEEKNKTFLLPLRVNYTLVNDSIIKATGRINLYIRKDSLGTAFKLGDKILVYGAPNVIKAPKNPAQFNYKGYLASKNIFHQQFTKRPNLKIISRGNFVGFMHPFYKLRIRLLEILQKVIPNANSRAVTEALVLGYKDNLDSSVKETYASVGAMHILAVSGLHIGIILIIINSILRPFEQRSAKNKAWSAAIKILVLFLYAFLTGFSPSVSRAATMFSLIIIAQATGRTTNIYNTLAVSAFILLVINPNNIFSVGFQLSYLAVLGIVYFYPKIYYLIESNNPLADKMWSLTCVSIAAQLGTFPIAIYYFNQFPIYFLLTNLIVIPAAFLILSLGIILLVAGLAWLPLAGYLGLGFSLLMDVLYQVLTFIKDLPFSKIDSIHITPLELLSIYFIIIFIALFIFEKEISYLVAVAISVFILSGLLINRQWQQYQQKMIIIYATNYDNIIDFVDGFDTRSYQDGKGLLQSARFNIDPFRVSKGLKAFEPEEKQIETYSVFQNGIDLITWNNKKIIILKDPKKKFEACNQKVEVDLLIVLNNAIISAESLASCFDINQLIIAESNNYYNAKLLLEDAKKINLNSYSISEKGAFVLKL